MAQIPQATFRAVALIDTTAHPVAWDFYGQFPVDPVRPAPQAVVVTARHRVDGMTWMSLLTSIREHVPNGGSALVVSHGTANGIFIPLFQGGPVMDATRMMEISSSLTISQERAAHLAGVHDVNMIRQFRRELALVQDKRLERIELRACNVGREPHVVENIRALFNVTYFGCPNIRDSFFRARPTAVRPDGESVAEFHHRFPNLPTRISWHEWEMRHTNRRYNYTLPEGRVSLFYMEVAHHRVICDLASDYNRAVFQWVDDKQPRGTWPGGPLSMHAFVGSPPIFPGDNHYRDHLRCVAFQRGHATQL